MNQCLHLYLNPGPLACGSNTLTKNATAPRLTQASQMVYSIKIEV